MPQLSTSVSTNFPTGSIKFFRGRLLTSNADDIEKLVDALEKESNTLRQEALKLAWYMRGGITYEQVLQLSFAERNFVSDLIKENLETTKKSGLPFF